MQISDRAKLLINYNKELERRCEKLQIDRDLTKEISEEEIARSVK